MIFSKFKVKNPIVFAEVVKISTLAWVVYFILRCLHLGRNNAFDIPLVSKFDWYIFHALSIDFLWIFSLALPWILASILVQNIPKWIVQILIFIHVILLPLTVIDQETMRFMGTHLTPDMFKTYGNSSALPEVIKFVSQDRVIPWLPLIILVLASPVFVIFLRLCKNWQPRFKASSISLVSLTLIFWLFLNVIWSGGNREQRLKPFYKVMWDGLEREKPLEIKPAEMKAAIESYQQAWLAEEGNSEWKFPNPKFPFWREPARPFIAQNKKPWNVIFLILETHRGVNAGYLKPWGSSRSSTPVIDSLAREGHAFARMNAGGVPTISALMSTHMSISEHPLRNLASSYTLLNNKGFPQILRENGYYTRFFSSADPAWDNQTPWLSQWYDGITYDRSRESDHKMFAHMARYISDSLPQNKPFFVTAMTKSNHYPFNAPEDMEDHPSGMSLEDKMDRTMKYTEEGIRNLLNTLKTKEFMKNTLVVIMADHGFSLGTHGSSDIGFGLYSEHTWIPLVIWTGGQNPLGQKPQIHTDVTSQQDLAPTFLDLAQIRVSNHYQGHSLLNLDRNQNLSSAFCTKGEESLLELGNYRIHANGLGIRAHGPEVFDAFTDRAELHNLIGDKRIKIYFDSIQKYIRFRTMLNTWAIEQNRLVPK